MTYENSVARAVVEVTGRDLLETARVTDQLLSEVEEEEEFALCERDGIVVFRDESGVRVMVEVTP